MDEARSEGDKLQRGPRVVVVGGGHGSAVALRAVRRFTDRVTAVVSVADDGGSSGRLREALDVVALGDLRKCLVALADPDSLLARAFEHRFEGGELSGHALGNLVLAGLCQATGGALTEAVQAAACLVGAHGHVVPATTEQVVLKAELATGQVAGQVAVSNAGRIAKVSLVPADAAASPEAVEAIGEAHLVVIGPGSLYTSVLAAAIVPGVAEALRATSARRVYICNLLPQVPETQGYNVADHVLALGRHGIDVDLVVYDSSRGMIPGGVGIPSVERSLVGDEGSTHDPARLAEVLRDVVV
jgi:uncharacterized cofD-like protein